VKFLQVVNWDEALEGHDDASDNDDDDDVQQGDAFDYRVDSAPAFSSGGADILRLPHGLKVVPTPWNGEAALDGARVAVRFRRGAQGIVSNSKLVKWSDGSFTLQVGNEVFPVSQVSHLVLCLWLLPPLTRLARTRWTATIGWACRRTRSTSCCSPGCSNATKQPL
jgi:hypothetical protein